MYDYVNHLGPMPGERGGGGGWDGSVERAVASHQCGPGLTPGLGVSCGLSLLLVLVLALRGFSGYSGFPFCSKPTLPNSDLIWSLRPG